MVYVCNPNTEQPEMAAVSRGTIHITIPKQCCKYSTSVHIRNALYIKIKNENLQSIIWNHMRQECSEFAGERRIAPNKSQYHHHDDHQRRTTAISDRRYTRDGTINTDMLLPSYLSPDMGKTFQLRPVNQYC